jgi:hypothetical protein
MVFGIADDRNASAAGEDYVPLGHSLCRIVRALGMNVRADQADQFANVGCIEDDHRIYIGKRGQNFRAFVLGDMRASAPFQLAHARVRVHGHHQLASQLLRSLQVAHMANMEYVKTSVGESDLLAGIAPLPYQLGKPGEVNQLVGGGRQVSPPPQP